MFNCWVTIIDEQKLTTLLGIVRGGGGGVGSGGRRSERVIAVKIAGQSQHGCGVEWESEGWGRSGW